MKRILLTIILFVFFVSPVVPVFEYGVYFKSPHVYAQSTGPVPFDAQPSPVGGLSCITFPGTINWSACAAYVAYYALLSPAAFVAGLTGSVLNFVTQELVYRMGAQSWMLMGVTNTWQVIRDVANTAIVFLLVFIGIAMIVQATNYNSRKLLISTLIAALLVNFSLFFTKVIIDFSNIFAVEAYRMILNTSFPAGSFGAGYEKFIPADCANVNGPDPKNREDPCYKIGLAGAFMQVTKLNTIYDSRAGMAAKFAGAGDKTQIYWTITWMCLLGAITLAAMSFIFIAAAVLLLTRWIVLVFLMIISALAFVSLVTGKFSIGKQWWTALINNALVAPVFFMMLWFSFVILKQMATLYVGAGTAFSSAAVQVNTPSMTLVLMYAVALGMAIGALSFARKLSSMGANLATVVAGTAMFGGAAWLGRQTLGRYGKYAANDENLKNRAADGDPVAKMALKTYEKMGKFNYDARTPIKAAGGEKYLGPTSGKGRLFGVQQGGYDKILRDRTKRETAFAKSLEGSNETNKTARELDTHNTQQRRLENERGKLEADQNQINQHLNDDTRLREGLPNEMTARQTELRNKEGQLQAARGSNASRIDIVRMEDERDRIKERLDDLKTEKQRLQGRELTDKQREDLEIKKVGIQKNIRRVDADIKTLKLDHIDPTEARLKQQKQAGKERVARAADHLSEAQFVAPTAKHQAAQDLRKYIKEGGVKNVSETVNSLYEDGDISVEAQTALSSATSREEFDQAWDEHIKDSDLDKNLKNKLKGAAKRQFGGGGGDKKSGGQPLTRDYLQRQTQQSNAAEPGTTDNSEEVPNGFPEEILNEGVNTSNGTRRPIPRMAVRDTGESISIPLKHIATPANASQGSPNETRRAFKQIHTESLSEMRVPRTERTDTTPGRMIPEQKPPVAPTSTPQPQPPSVRPQQPTTYPQPTQQQQAQARPSTSPPIKTSGPNTARTAAPPSFDPKAAMLAQQRAAKPVVPQKGQELLGQYKVPKVSVPKDPINRWHAEEAARKTFGKQGPFTDEELGVALQAESAQKQKDLIDQMPTMTSIQSRSFRRGVTNPVHEQRVPQLADYLLKNRQNLFVYDTKTGEPKPLLEAIPQFGRIEPDSSSGFSSAGTGQRTQLSREEFHRAIENIEQLTRGEGKYRFHPEIAKKWKGDVREF